MVQTRENYPALDGLRGVSCICIVMMHMRAASCYTGGGVLLEQYYRHMGNNCFLVSDA